MSGIAGIFHRNRDRLDFSHLKSMGAALGHRGPGGVSYFQSNHIGLIHCMLHDTQEALLEKLPSSTPDKRLRITFHGRIDNRVDLKDKTSWQRPLEDTPDSDLILAAYDKWGSDCVYHLSGDFVFAVWDEPAQKLFCARDHMGVKPFYYLLTDTCFAFASEIKGLLALPFCPRKINEERIADYLTCVVTDNESTFYSNIFRLAPAHFLEVDLDQTRKVHYWHPKPARLACRNNTDYEEQFYEIFANAVRHRLRACFPVGAYLSGGLDSTSIVSMAAGPQRNYLPGPLHTFSGIFDELTQCDERNYFNAILDRYDVMPHFIHADRIDPGNAFESVIDTEDEPFWAPHFFMMRELMSLAEKTGMRVMLDGHDGDSAVSHGYGLFPELLERGRLIKLAKECYAMGNTSFRSTYKRFLGICKQSALYRLSSVLPVGMQKDHFAATIANLNKSFVQRTNIKERLHLAEAGRPQYGQTEYVRHLNTINQPLHPIALEFLERQSVYHGLVNRHPYFDKSLIEFCLALPAEQKFRNGFNRNIVREALRSIIPANIAKRRSKTSFAPNVTRAFSIPGRHWLDLQVDSLAESVYYHTDRERINRIYSRFISEPSGVTLSEQVFLLGSICLSRWLLNNRW